MPAACVPTVPPRRSSTSTPTPGPSPASARRVSCIWARGPSPPSPLSHHPPTFRERGSHIPIDLQKLQGDPRRLVPLAPGAPSLLPQAGGEAGLARQAAESRGEGGRVAGHQRLAPILDLQTGESRGRP